MKFGTCLELGSHSLCIFFALWASQTPSPALIKHALPSLPLLPARAVGDTVVRACAEESTHYFDLSVETDLHREVREGGMGERSQSGISCGIFLLLCSCPICVRL